MPQYPNYYDLLSKNALNAMVFTIQKYPGLSLTSGSGWNPVFLQKAFQGMPNADLLTSIANTRYTYVDFNPGSSGTSQLRVTDLDTSHAVIVTSGTELHAGLWTAFKTLTADFQIAIGLTNIPGSPYQAQYNDLSNFITRQNFTTTQFQSTVDLIGLSSGGFAAIDVAPAFSIPLDHLGIFEAPGPLGLFGTVATLGSFGIIRGNGQMFTASTDFVPGSGLGPAATMYIGDGDFAHGSAGVARAIANSLKGYLGQLSLPVTKQQAQTMFGQIYDVAGTPVWFRSVNGVSYLVSPTGGNIDGHWTVNQAQIASGQLGDWGAQAAAAQAQAGLGVRLTRANNGAELVGESLGSQFGIALGGHDPLAQVAAGTLLGAVGAMFGQYLDYDLAGVQFSHGDAAANTFGEQLGASFRDTGVSVISSTLTNDLMHAAGIAGFAGQLSGVVVDTAIANSIKTGLSTIPGFGVSRPDGLFTGLKGSIAAFFGQELGTLVVGAQTQAGAILGSLGSTVGSLVFTKVFTYFGAVLGAGVGAFIGDVIGTLIGNLFGSHKPKTISASAETVLQVPFARYEVGATTATNGGDVKLATTMATAARDSLNGLIGLMSHDGTAAAVANVSSPTQSYGHTNSQLYVKLAGTTYNYGSSEQAVDKGVTWAIKQTSVIGGDLMVKRAIAHSAATTVLTMIGDVQVALDYEKYRQDWQDWNQLIAANPNSALTAGWIQTFQRANELQLTSWAPSDFYGGLKGFIDSFDPQTRIIGYEDIGVHLQGAGLQFTLAASANPTGAQGFFEILPQAAADGRSVTVDNFTAGSLGYYGWDTSSSNVMLNNVIDMSGASGGQVIDDFAPASGYTGGDDVEIGSNFGDSLQGRVGRDWLDGGAGNDTMHGGQDNDVVLGGDGDDLMFGDKGDDYLAGGAGNDTMWGGDGNDTLIGKGGSDSMTGDLGDDVFIVNADGGATPDSMDGGAGNDTISYERFAAAVSVDLRTGSYYGDNWVSVENLTGGLADDNLTGSDGDNVLRGLAGSDTLNGGAGNDTLEGGDGADSLVGGSGINYVSYAASAAGVLVDLTAGSAFGGDATGDVFSGVNGVVGSAYGDTLTGSAASDTLLGGDGADQIVATAGADTYDGGTGFNIVSYANATSGVAVYLGATIPGSISSGYGSAGMAAGQTLTSISGVIGSAYDDNLSGGAGDQIFIGGHGNDILQGGAGSDTYVFGRGDGADQVTDTNADANVLSFAQGLTYSDLYLETQGGAQGYLRVGVFNASGVNDTITVGGNFATGGNNIIKAIDIGGQGRIQIGDTEWAVSGGPGDETLYGIYSQTEVHDFIMGQGGNDTIYGAYKNGAVWESKGNVIIGGQGNDLIYTSVGDDQFVFERGDGRDVIVDTGGDDTLVFGPSVSIDDVIYEIVNNDLVIGLRDPNHPDYTAGQVADSVRVTGGGYMLQRYQSGNIDPSTLNTMEYVTAGNTTVDVRKLNLDWTIVQEDGSGPISPVVFDLTGNGLNMTSVIDTNIVVKGSDGNLSQMSWISPSNGFLAVDRNHDGKIDRASEISFTQDLKGATTDLQGLAAWDTNGDGKLDKTDAHWNDLLMWVDKNQNGQSSKGELQTLDQAGIASIDLKGAPHPSALSSGIDSFVSNTISVTRKDGSSMTGYDVSLAHVPLGSTSGVGPGLVGDGVFGSLLNNLKVDAKTAGKLGPLTAADIFSLAKTDFNLNLDNVLGMARWAAGGTALPAFQAGGMTGADLLEQVKASKTKQVGRASAMSPVESPTSPAIGAGGVAPAPEIVADAGDVAQVSDSGAMGLSPVSPTLLPVAPNAEPQSSVSADASVQAWWRNPSTLAEHSQAADGWAGGKASGGDEGVQRAVGPDATVEGASIDLLHSQQVLRQALAGFGGDAGSGGAAVWRQGDRASMDGLMSADPRAAGVMPTRIAA